MISLGRRDARKELGLGFDGGGEMDDSGLEEGEACLDPDNDDNYDASIDPDVALSYIDVKLQDVLGHFQKEFEGQVSAENLGAKFDGYGTFLPTYQRSPVWSQTRIPSKVQHHNEPRSPNSSQLEVGCRGSVSSSSVLQSGNTEPASGSAVSLISSKAACSPAVAAKQEVTFPSTSCVKEYVQRSEFVNRKSTVLPEQRMLKVRIKVGSDNLSTQKNAAIYSGLGLDVSPSSSLDNSPSGSEGMSHGPQDSPFESPTHIFQIMTSFPVPGGILLSPLPSNLIHLKEKERLHQCSDGKTKKTTNRSEISAELKSEYKDSQSGLDVLVTKMGLDALACESNTLKFPILSNSNPLTDTAKGIVRAANMPRETHNGAARDGGFSEFKNGEQTGPMNAHEDCLVENTKTTSLGMIWGDKKSGSLDSVSVYPRKDGHHKGEKPYGMVKGNSKGTTAVSSELTDAPKHKVDQKGVAFREDEGTKSSSEGKKNLKGNGKIVPGMPMDVLAGGNALMAKNKKTTSSDGFSTKRDLADLKPKKNTGRIGDRYSDFFGEIKLDREEKWISSLELGYEDRHKDLNLDGEKGTHLSNNALTWRPSGKKIEKLSRPQVHPKMIFPPGSVSGPLLDTAPLAVAPAAAEDNWVCCDKCQKWRLLPLGKNPNDLPEKWLCSMLNWLPGMNRCSLSEKETTDAVMALNQVPVLQSQNIMQINPGGDISSLTSVGNQLDQKHLTNGSQTNAVGGKKTYKDGPALLSNSMKSIPVSVANVSLNGVNQPVVRECDILKPSKASDLALENHKLKQKEKHKVVDNCSNGGDSWRSKMKDKRDSEKEFFRSSKKVKTEGVPEDWVSDPVNIEKIGASSTNGLLTMSSGNNMPKNNGFSSSKYHASARKRTDEQISFDDMPLDSGKRDDGEVGNKRKIKENHSAQVNAGSLTNTGHVLQDSRILAKEEFSENECREEKKAKISRSDGKESNASKGNCKIDKKGSHRKSQQLGKEAGGSVSQRSLDGVDYLKRDSGGQQPSVAAASSSSKISGSYKTKANFLETKGSPVESVSSSPLRVLKQGGLKRCSDGVDDGGSDRSGTAKKEISFDVARHGSHESSVHDILDEDLSHSGYKAKQLVVPSPDVTAHKITNAGAESVGQDGQYLYRTSTSDRRHGNDRKQDHYHANGSRPRKSGKGSSSWSKEKSRNLNYGFDNSKVKVPENINEQTPSHELKQIDGRSKIEEKFGVRSDESENRYNDKNGSIGLVSSESSKKESQSKFQGYNGTDIKAHAIYSHDDTSGQQNMQPDAEAGSGRGISPSLPPSGTAHNETLPHCSQPFSGYLKGSGANISDSDNASKALKQIRKVDHAHGNHHSSSRDPSANGHRAGDLDAPSPVKRDSSSQAATNALKEAKNIKHLADRLKNSGSNDSTKIYFEAALKFLHGASLLETGEMIQSMHVYSTTAKLCEFCAHEYEKSKDAAAAALAYKCTEVAYMRVIHSSHASATKDRHELQTALQMVHPGESPSSSASDVDNLNHLSMLDKGPLAKGISSPQVAATHVIAARNRPNFVRLLNFVQEVNFAMEASRKSRISLAAANANLGETQQREGITLIKTALDFSFQDVEGLLRLVRLAFEAISR